MKTGYSWNGWSGTYEWSDKRKIFIVTGAVSLTANARVNTYYVDFHPNGGGGSMGTMTCKYDQTYRLPKMIFEKSEKQAIYLGWHTDQNAFAPIYGEEERIQNLTAEDGVTIHLFIIWDYAPELKSADRYFTLYEAKKGALTEGELLRTVASEDREEATTEVRVKDYNSSLFTGMTESGTKTITYVTTDREEIREARGE